MLGGEISPDFSYRNAPEDHAGAVERKVRLGAQIAVRDVQTRLLFAKARTFLPPPRSWFFFASPLQKKATTQLQPAGLRTSLVAFVACLV